jgi:hypothetical protein
MTRRTINVPDSVDELVQEIAGDGESYSATVTRLIQAGARSILGKRRPSYVGSGDGPEDLGRLAETYLRRLARSQ